MKLKKLFIPIILLFILLLPFVVSAEVCEIDKVSIKSIEFESKKGEVIELESASADDKNINLNLSMSDVGDNIKYKVIVENNSKNDFKLNIDNINIDSDYVDYTFETEDDSNIVKSNSTKTIYLSVKYKNEVPISSFRDGKFQDNKVMALNLTTGDLIDVPNTFKSQSYTFVIITILLLIILTIIIVLNKKNYSKDILIIIGIIFIIPISVYASCECDIVLNSNIKITKNYDGNGIIYTDNTFIIFDVNYPKTGESFSFLTEKKPVSKWCVYKKDDTNLDDDVCVYDSEESCNEGIDNYRCLEKTDGSWNSCINDNYGFENDSVCQTTLNNDISNGYASVGEYTCVKDDGFVCKKENVLEGDYTIFRDIIEQKVFYKYETENNIIKRSYLCFVADKDYCFDGDLQTIDYNMSILRELENWFNENGGSCTFYETEGYCNGGGYSTLLVRSGGAEIQYYLEDPYDITIPYFYCLYGGSSACAP